MVSTEVGVDRAIARCDGRRLDLYKKILVAGSDAIKPLWSRRSTVLDLPLKL